jgi:hypothetical protein
MEKHEETCYEADSKKIIQCLLNYKLFKKLNEDNLQLQNPQRLMAFKIDQLLLNGLENLVTLIGKTKHHYYVKVARTKDKLEAKVKL